MPIFDQGYQHWSGTLSSQAWRWLAVARHGVRVGMKNRVLRFALLIAWLPALALAFMICLWSLHERGSELITPLLPMLRFLDPQIIAEPLNYRVEVWTLFYDYFLLTELRLSMILILIVGPGLISQDLRFNALPLYLSRPVRRIDYFVGKFGVVAYFLGMVLIVPSIIAYVLGLLFSLDLTIIRDTFPLLLSALGYGALMTLSAGTLILALSALTRNSRYVALFWLAIWFVSSITSEILDEIHQNQQRQVLFLKMHEENLAFHQNPGRPPEERQQRQREHWRREAELWKEIRKQQLQDSRTNWRPMVSYTANLSRIGRELLGTDKAWEKLAQNQPPDQRDHYLLRNMGPQYPWYWSAIVLAVLFGLSACILNLRVKSLDRLK